MESGALQPPAPGARRTDGTGSEYDASYYEALGEAPYGWASPDWVDFFETAADFIVEALRPRTVLDAGCAVGLLAGALRKRGVDARGFDISEYAISQVPDWLQPYCVTGSITDEIDGWFDLICCIEVLEHVPPSDAAAAIENFAAHTDTVLLSSTPHDFEEPTHVNVRPPEDWVRAFGEWGFVPKPLFNTIVVSPQAVVFERRDATATEVAAEFERVRYHLAFDLRSERESAAREREAAVRELEAAAHEREAAATMVRTVEARAAAATREADEAKAALDVVLGTTWWRVGRPLRRAVTALRLRTGLVEAQASPRRPFSAGVVEVIKPVVPLRARRALRREFPQAFNRSEKAGAMKRSIDEIVGDALPLLRPLRVFPAPCEGRRRLTLVTDSLNAGSLFGGVGTSIILATLLAERLDVSLRIATRRERPNPPNFNAVLRAQDLRCDREVEFVFARIEGGGAIPVRERDLFLTTSWWSTWSALRGVNPESVVYLLQEDERLFYPAGDEQVACAEVLADDRIRFVVNTAMLQEHLVRDGFGNVGRHGVSFEPAFPSGIYFPDSHRPTNRREFFFYARPGNARNLFLRGIEAVNEAIATSVLDPDEWTFRFVGSGVPGLVLEGGIAPHISENLPWLRYVELIRRVDVGVSLMSTPHPSYPPLDLAACGAVAVTNRFGLKQQLDRYSANIVCTDLSVDAIVQGIASAVELAEDERQRFANYEAQQLSRSWRESFEPVLDELAAHL